MTEACQQAIYIVEEIRRFAPSLYLLLVIAIAALAWQWVDDWHRDRVCKDCDNCQRKLHPMDQLPPPSSGVQG